MREARQPLSGGQTRPHTNRHRDTEPLGIPDELKSDCQIVIVQREVTSGNAFNVCGKFSEFTCAIPLINAPLQRPARHLIGREFLHIRRNRRCEDAWHGLRCEALKGTREFTHALDEGAGKRSDPFCVLGEITRVKSRT